jgi:uncharacterized protein (TIGR02147 family)
VVTPKPLTDYQSYREILKDHYEQKKQARASFSFREFATRAGLKSPNYLQLVMTGRRNLQSATARRVGQAMGLKPAELEFFQALVDVDNAANAESRHEAEKALSRVRSKLVTRLMSNAQRGLLSAPHHLLIRECAMLDDFELDPAWVFQKLRGLLPIGVVEESLGLLVQSGALQKKSGRWRPADPVIDTGHAFEADLVLDFHKNLWRFWLASLDQLPKSERELGLINVPISSSRIEELRQRLRQFQDELIGWLETDQAPNQVVQLGFYLMPVSKT